MTARGWTRDASTDRGGFVLVMTLLLLGLVSAGAVAIMIEAKAGATGVAGLAEAARHRAVARAGVARAVYGSMTDDPLRVFATTEAEPVNWRFDGMIVALSATPESDRIDLNAGRIELVESVLARANMDDALRAALLDAVVEARASGRRLPGVAALTRPCLRSSATLTRLENAFTVLTRASGVAPRSGADENLALIPSLTAQDRDLVDRAIRDGRSPIDDRRLGHLRPFLSDRSSQYRISSRPEGAGLERQVVISLAIRWPYAELTASRWTRKGAANHCD